MRRVSATGIFAGASITQSRAWSYKARTREYGFVHETLNYDKHFKEIGQEETCTPEFVNTIAEECGKLCENTLFPLYMSGDQEGCKLDKDNYVTTPKGFKEAWKAIVEGGWQGVNGPEKYGGQGLPPSIAMLSKELMATANWALCMYPGLSAGAAVTLLHHGTEQMRELYLRKILAGEWTGTMCLTEPHCGTDLAQVKTKAVPVPGEDNKYKISGTKIFISSGDHDLAENIVHIVLARLPDSPSGTKGISLFLVPKFVPKNEDGSELSDKRNLLCTALEKKMGIHGNATCQMTFEDSEGYLIGGPNEGLKQMFTFMNTARIGTAMQGVAHAEMAFQNALSYARERTSMRSLSGAKNPDKVADLIIHHPGVRQHILFCKAVAEAGRCMLYDMAKITDKIELAEAKGDKKLAKKLDNELGLLTPIAKGCITELGLEAALQAQTVYGGHGFIQGNGMELIVRDARISTLYEGTTGVQALDFIGRKVLLAKGGELNALSKKISALAKANMFKSGSIGANARALFLERGTWRLAVYKIMAGALKDKDFVGSAATDFMMYSGYIVLGYYQLLMAVKAQEKIDAGLDTDGYYKSKVDTCNFYYARVMPRGTAHGAIMMQDAGSVMKPDADAMDL